MPGTIASPDGESRVEKTEQRRKSTPRAEGIRSRKEKAKSPNNPKTPTNMDDYSRVRNRNEAEKKEELQLMPIQRRPKPSESYEKPMSGRESWWRSTIKETPTPGSYDYEDMVKNLRSRKNTYRFKSDGRKRDPHPQIGKGKYLMPGAYEHEDLDKRIAKFSETYGFKNTSRESRDMMTFGKKDKDINVPPNAYEMGAYLSIHADKTPSKHWTFKSASTRFPTTQFVPKEGPGPGGYEHKSSETVHAVSSSFSSKTPRFSTSHTRTPGPGSYDRMYRPMTETVTKMGRHYGIFFTPRFEAY